MDTPLQPAPGTSSGSAGDQYKEGSVLPPLVMLLLSLCLDNPRFGVPHYK